MNLINKEMYVLKRKNSESYMRNNGYFADINDETCKSAIRLYETKNLAESAVRRYSDYKESYDFPTVMVTVEIKA